MHGEWQCFPGQHGGRGTALDVWCFAHVTGSYENTPFSLVVTQPRSAPSGTYDYSFVYKDASSGTLTGPYQYNSARKKNRVRHLGTGRYQVTLGGPRSAGISGTVKVTAWGNQPGECNLIGWHGSKSGEVVNVDCFTAALALQDRSFTLVYASTSNLMGLNGKTDANAFANGTGVYQPKVQYDSRRGARVTVVEYSPGQYEVLFGGSGSNAPGANPGDVEVSTVGTGRQCYITNWLQELTPSADIICVNKAGSVVGAAFTIQWVVA